LIEYAQSNVDQNKRWNPIDNIKIFSSELSKEQLIQQMEDLQKTFADKDLMRKYLEQLTTIRQQTLNSIADLKNTISNTISKLGENNINTHIVNFFLKRTPEIIIKDRFNTTLLKAMNGESAFYKKTGKSKHEQELLQTTCDNELLPQVNELYSIIYGSAACEYFTANAILDKLHSLGILQDVSAQIDETNRKLGRLPISEINRLINLIIDGQDSPFIYERIGQYYNHYMIDEFQDTSQLQWKNFKPLIVDAESNGHDNLIVGDVKQSIYRFRNSDWHLLNQVDADKDILDKQPGKGMGNNWRTAKVIVDNNERLMQAYCKWVVDEFKKTYDNQYHDKIDEIAHIYDYKQMHQEAKKSYDGYFHMQFFEGKNYRESALDTLLQQIKTFQEENINLSRVTILTRYSKDVESIAQFLIQHGYEVQSAGGLRIGAHTTVQILIHLLKLSIKRDDSTISFLQNAVPDFEQYDKCRLEAQTLPLYDHIQALIDGLKLNVWEGATPYLTAFQDKVFQFTQSKIADTALFLEYWELKGKDSTIPAPKTSSAINIMTIHSSKGLEFDIVMIPFFDWKLADSHPNNIIWCKPTVAPFDTLSLVPVYPSQILTRSYFAKDYILEELASHTDNLNLTYVAITRPRYRLYIYGQKFATNSKNEVKISTIGQLISYLFDEETDEQNTYTSLTPLETAPRPLPPKEEITTKTKVAQYVSTPIEKRLVLRMRSENDFTQDTPLAIVDLGILMHEWLSHIHTWDDAPDALKQLMIGGEITQKQADEMQEQLTALQALIKQHNHDDWFSNQYQVLTEQDIITPSGKTYRPDRVMIKDKHAIVIDYKFGEEQLPSYVEQVREYILLLKQLGYTSEGYIVYNKTKIIQPIQ
jgi:ATP-dependent exoDNAse (exonuclease V) beta subunit